MSVEVGKKWEPFLEVNMLDPGANEKLKQLIEDIHGQTHGRGGVINWEKRKDGMEVPVWQQEVAA